MADPVITTIEIILMVPVALILGVLFLFLFRKLNARFQWRVGPVIRMYSDLAPLIGKTRIWQPLYDILKLFGKDTIITDVAHRRLFVYSPYFSLLFAISAAFFIPFPGMELLSSVPYSLVIASYLIISSILFTILGPVASGSPWGAIGARREVELFLVSELSFVLSIFSIALSSGTLVISEIAGRGWSAPSILLSLTSGLLLFVAMLGKLHIKPFDMPEAEAEIVAGPYTEYSGKLLGIYFLSKTFLTYVLVALFIALILPPASTSIFWLPAWAFAAMVLVFLLTVVQVLNPRYRINNALYWYVKVVIPVGLVSFIIAFFIRVVA
ncbi:MAG: NADH-quinone oxidoreductase subunit H [Candidatus Methanomethylicia archaeon]|nr:NADH-quinone oxidoreductase subunit H [Candidatus Methanomethylicia archaeon]